MARNRKKRCIKKVRLLDIGWSGVHMKALEQVKTSLCDTVKLSLRDPNKIICNPNDASDLFLSGMVTQCHINKLLNLLLD